MNIILGIDGGGTKTHCIAADQNGNVLSEQLAGSSNFLIEGEASVAEKLYGLISDCLKHLHSNFSDVLAIVIGSKGAGRQSDARKLKTALEKYLQSKNIRINNLHITSDAEIALEGAFTGKPGCILICGTGSIMYGKDPAGKIHRVGGYGKFIGDEGSGYSIGRKGLQLLSKVFDGRSESPLFLKFFSEKFSISSGKSLIVQVYSNNFDIASASPMVISAAAKGDMNCIQIIEAECNELLQHITAMKKMMNSEFNLCLMGGLLEKENYFSLTLREKINASHPGIKIQTPEFTPAYGAVLTGKKIFDI